MESSTLIPKNTSPSKEASATFNEEGFLTRNAEPDWSKLSETLIQSLIEKGLITDNPPPKLTILTKTESPISKPVVFTRRAGEPNWETSSEMLIQSLIEKGLIKRTNMPKPVLEIVPKTSEPGVTPKSTSALREVDGDDG
jgi:hypothetical protein